MYGTFHGLHFFLSVAMVFLIKITYYIEIAVLLCFVQVQNVCFLTLTINHLVRSIVDMNN